MKSHPKDFPTFGRLSNGLFDFSIMKPGKYFFWVFCTLIGVEIYRHFENPNMVYFAPIMILPGYLFLFLLNLAGGFSDLFAMSALKLFTDKPDTNNIGHRVLVFVLSLALLVPTAYVISLGDLPGITQ